MSRSLVRRLAAAGTVVGCLAVATLPAAAQSATEDIQVSYVVADGTRQFKVTELDGTTPLSDFAFDGQLQKPFRTLVNDTNRLLDSEGYQVNASMTDLYLRNPDGTYDYSHKIASKDLALTYGATPLAGTAALPVVPQVRLQGVIGTCADSSVADALGISPLTDPLGSLLDPLFLLLDPITRSVCQQLGALTPLARTVDVTVEGLARTVTAPLALPDLPFALTGGQQGGAFTNPSYQGAIASNDPARTGAAAPTVKRIMTGSPLLSGGDLTGLLDGLTSRLTAELGGTPLLALDNTGVTALNDALAAISSENTALAAAISDITSTVDQLDLVQNLTSTLLNVDLSALSSVTGEYGAFPVLKANPTATRPGTYEGTLVVDFFETR